MLSQEKGNLTWKALQTLPGSAAYWKWAACVPSVGPGPWFQKEQSRTYSEIIFFVLTCVRLDKECKVFVPVLPNSELTQQKSGGLKNTERWTKIPQPLGTSVNSTVDLLKPRRESWRNEGIQKHPCISGNLESHVPAQDRIYAKKRPMKNKKKERKKRSMKIVA